MKPTSALPEYLFRKGNAVRYSVPTIFQPIIGRRQIVRGLGTQDLGERLRNVTRYSKESRIGQGSANAQKRNPQSPRTKA